MPPDVLAQIAELPGVDAAAARARDALDALLWDRQVRAAAHELARRSALRGGWANAAMDGAEVPFDSVLAGEVEDSPMGVRAARTVALTLELPKLEDTFALVPLQVWARMNTVLVAGLVPEQEVGRPRPDSDAEDPLRLGGLPMAMESSARLTALATLIVEPTAAPAVVAAGVVHGELATLRPFRHASGPLARATIRLSLASRGVDPGMMSVPESGLLASGRAQYVRALRAYASGTPEGLASWLEWFAEAIAVGARQSQAIASELA